MSQGRAGASILMSQTFIDAYEACCTKPLCKCTRLISCEKQMYKQWTGDVCCNGDALKGDIWWERTWSLNLLICKMCKLDDISAPFQLSNYEPVGTQTMSCPRTFVLHDHWVVNTPSDTVNIYGPLKQSVFSCCWPLLAGSKHSMGFSLECSGESLHWSFAECLGWS